MSSFSIERGYLYGCSLSGSPCPGFSPAGDGLCSRCSTPATNHLLGPHPSIIKNPLSDAINLLCRLRNIRCVLFSLDSADHSYCTRCQELVSTINHLSTNLNLIDPSALLLAARNAATMLPKRIETDTIVR